MPSVRSEAGGLDYFEFIDQSWPMSLSSGLKSRVIPMKVKLMPKPLKPWPVKLKKGGICAHLQLDAPEDPGSEEVYQDAKCLIEWDTLVLR